MNFRFLDAARLLLALRGFLERIGERRVLVLRLQLLKGLHHQQVPARQLARSLLAPRATSLGHCIFRDKNFCEPVPPVLRSSERSPYFGAPTGTEPLFPRMLLRI